MNSIAGAIIIPGPVGDFLSLEIPDMEILRYGFFNSP